MRNFIKTTQAEWLKLKGLGLVYAALVLAVIPPLLVFLFLYLSKGAIMFNSVSISVFEDFTNQSIGYFAKFFLLILIIAAASRICQIDHKNGGWLLMETQPVSKFSLFLAKYINLVILTFIALVAFFIFSSLSGALWQITFAEGEKKWDFDLVWHIQLFLKVFISSLGVSAFLLFISMIIQNYMWPFIIGITGILLNLVSLIRQEYYLFSPMFTEQLALKESNIRSLNSFLGFSEVLSIFWSVFFLAVGYLWYSQKSFKRAFLFDTKTILRTLGILAFSGVSYYFIQKPRQLESLDDGVKITGTIYGENLPDTLKLVSEKHNETIAVIAVKEGSFSYSAPKSPADGLYQLNSENGKVNSTLLLSKGSMYNLDIYYDTHKTQEFSRSNRKAELELLMKPLSGQLVLFSQIYKDSPDKFYAETQKMWNDVNRKINAYRTSENFGVNSSFKEYKVQTEAVQILSLIDMYQKNSGGKDSKAPEALTASLKKQLEKPTELTKQNPAYTAYKLSLIKKPSDNGAANVLEELKSLDKGDERDRLIATQITETIEKETKAEEREKLVNEYVNELSDERYKKAVLQRLESLKKEKRGIPFPAITMKDDKDGSVTIGDFRDKYTIIEVWSVSNKPSTELREVFDQKAQDYRWQDNVRFVSLNIDSENEKWLTALKDKPSSKSVKNVRLNSSKETNGIPLNEVIPKYFVIDPDGNIYNFDAPKPDNNAFDEMVNTIRNLE